MDREAKQIERTQKFEIRSANQGNAQVKISVRKLLTDVTDCAISVTSTTSKEAEAMTNLIDVFNELEKHASEWLEFSQKNYGWQTREYADYVRCYFADSTDHRTVAFGKYGCTIQISMFSPVYFSDMTMNSLANAEAILNHARALLDQERLNIDLQSAERCREEKVALAAKLRERLAELECEPIA